MSISNFFKTFFLYVLVLVSCSGPQSKENKEKHYVVNTEVIHPEWTESATIYEINIRQYTHEGTFSAFMEHLPRLQEMGVDIIWLMPVFPIGELNRKATQTVLVDEIIDPKEREKYYGSYYSTKDYLSVNPEYGTLDDFKTLVTEIHDLGMYVILDIAVNHTAWDHEWVTTNPEYYTRIETGTTPWNPVWMQEHPAYYKRIRNLGMTYPIDPNETDWWDVADLNYNNKELREELKGIFKYWVSDMDIDGYRCDVAGWVPCDFWNGIRAALDSIKPVFMLAEDEANRCLEEKAFDMNYAWELHHIMNEIAQNRKTADDLKNYFIRMDSIYDPNIYRMNFITNHDENSWNGAEFERMGEAVEVFAMLTFTLPGMPLLYTGQEIGWDKRLLFFEKDEVHWTDSRWEQFYADMIKLKKEHSVFWNGSQGGSFTLLPVAESENVFTFERSNDDETFLILVNLGNKKVEIRLDKSFSERDFTDIFSDEEINPTEVVKLKRYSYKILTENF